MAISSGLFESNSVTPGQLLNNLPRIFIVSANHNLQGSTSHREKTGGQAYTLYAFDWGDDPGDSSHYV
ncbi:MAG: hypothetical protein ABL878_15325 [Burkholderiales bacterium]